MAQRLRPESTEPHREGITSSKCLFRQNREGEPVEVVSVVGNDVPEFRLISRRGAFDLARRLTRDLRNIPRMPELLGSILTRAENAALGLA